MRYTIKVELGPRKKDTQYAVYDNLEARVIVRYASEKKAQDLIDRYEEMVKNR